MELPDRRRSDPVVVPCQRLAQWFARVQVPHLHHLVAAATDRDRAALQRPTATVPLWPFNSSYSSSLESRSHTRTVASWLAETTIGRVVGVRIDIAALQSSGQLRLEDRGRPPIDPRAPSFAPTLNRQQCPPGRALAPADTAGMASRLRPAATRRVELSRSNRPSTA